MKRLKQKDLYRFIPKFLIPHSLFLIARQRKNGNLTIFHGYDNIFSSFSQLTIFPVDNPMIKMVKY